MDYAPLLILHFELYVVGRFCTRKSTHCSISGLWTFLIRRNLSYCLIVTRESYFQIVYFVVGQLFYI